MSARFTIYNNAVFISGFSVTALELLGFRILAPYAGTTVSVWASLFSITLLGTGVGYYIGGWFSDRKQSKETVGNFLVGTGCATLIIIPLKKILPVLAGSLSVGTTSLVAAFVLFFLPNLFSGIVITYTTRLALSNIASIGSTSGTLYSIATLGGIAGIFGTSYLLVPNIGSSMILFYLGFLLILSGGIFAARK